jgi:hypothetical protein
MNSHAQRSKDLLANSASQSLEMRTLRIATAQAEASLAIAYELQTANILALEARLLKKPSCNEDMLVEVSERLGYSLDSH